MRRWNHFQERFRFHKFFASKFSVISDRSGGVQGMVVDCAATACAYMQQDIATRYASAGAPGVGCATAPGVCGDSSHLHLSQICRFQVKSSHIILAGFLPAPCVELIPFVCRKYVRNLHENVRDSHIWPPKCCRPHKVFEPCDMTAISKYFGFFLLCAASQLASLLVALQ